MKFLVVFAAVLTVALGARSQWNLNQISRAIQSPITNPSLIPVLEDALEVYMQASFAGEDHDYISISTAPVDLDSWSLREISAAIENPNTNPGLMPFLVHALETLMDNIFSEAVPSTTTVSITIPGMDISYWTMRDLDYALSHDPIPEMVPYLEQGLNKLMESLFNEIPTSFVVLAIPVDIVDSIPTPAAEPVSPVAVHPGNEIEVGSEVLPTPVGVPPVAPAASGNPLVEIILNINQQSIGASPVAITGPTPGFMESRPPVPGFLENRPIPVEEINPSPIIPDPVVLPQPENPIDIVAVSPPEVNPVDMINPLPVIVVGGHDVGPM